MSEIDPKEAWIAARVAEIQAAIDETWPDPEPGPAAGEGS